jgi:hypothetical protein
MLSPITSSYAGGRIHKTSSGTDLELEWPPSARLPSRGRPGLSLHVEQRRASRSECDGHLVHRTIVPRRDGGHRRSVLADIGIHAAIRRRRPIGADVGGAGLWGASLHACSAGHVDCPLGVAADHPRIRSAWLIRLVDFRAFSHAPGNAAAGPRILVSAHARWIPRHRTMVAARFFQRHRPSDYHPVDNHRCRRGQCDSESVVHVQFRVGDCGLGLGNGRRPADRRRRDVGIIFGERNTKALPLPSHSAITRRRAAWPAELGVPDRAVDCRCRCGLGPSTVQPRKSS